MPENKPTLATALTTEVLLQLGAGELIDATPGQQTRYTVCDAAQAERVTLLIEEMAEAQQEACKILRHGFESQNPLIPNAPTNRVALEKELGNAMAAAVLLAEAGDIDMDAVVSHMEHKLADYGRWLHHQPPALLQAVIEGR